MRALRYISGFYLDYVRSGRKIGLLSPIFPIAPYNGSRKRFGEDREVGLQQGREEQARQTVLALLSRGMAVRDIDQITGLSQEDIKALQHRR